MNIQDPSLPTDRPQLPPLQGGLYEAFYLALATLFIASLVACNLIFTKFFVAKVPLPWGGEYVFVQSVGLLAYPLTFLVTDILSEVYGAERSNRVVTMGFIASCMTVALVEIADATTSAGFGTSDETFHAVFGLSKIGVLASMSAYLCAQYVDVRLFHFWKRLTRGKHLWLRNNASTFASQVLDTTVVLGLLAAFQVGGVSWSSFPELAFNGLMFKWSFALVDTPIFYACVHGCRRLFPEQMAMVDTVEMGDLAPS